MSSRQDLMLEEMGITPRWRSRGGESQEMQATPVVALDGASVEPDPGNRRESIMRMDWAGLKACVTSCKDCVLHQRRIKTVFGVGDERADWLFVGEGPGADEDQQGEPFVGQAGKIGRAHV